MIKIKINSIQLLLSCFLHFLPSPLPWLLFTLFCRLHSPLPWLLFTLFSPAFSKSIKSSRRKIKLLKTTWLLQPLQLLWLLFRPALSLHKNFREFSKWSGNPNFLVLRNLYGSRL